METSIWMSFSSTPSQALSYVSGALHFPILALQLTLLLNGKQIQTLLREQGVKKPVQPHEPHNFGKLLVGVAQGSAAIQKGDLPSLILPALFDRAAMLWFHSSLWPCCVSTITPALLKGRVQARSTAVCGTRLWMNYFSKDGLVWYRPYRGRQTHCHVISSC